MSPRHLLQLLLACMQARRDKARDLLQRGWQPHMQQPKYDPEHALVLCRQHNYRPGLVLLYDKKRLHREVLAVYMEAQDYDGLIAACIQYGELLWAACRDKAARFAANV